MAYLPSLLFPGTCRVSIDSKRRLERPWIFSCSVVTHVNLELDNLKILRFLYTIGLVVSWLMADERLMIR